IGLDVFCVFKVATLNTSFRMEDCAHSIVEARIVQLARKDRPVSMQIIAPLCSFIWPSYFGYTFGNGIEARRIASASSIVPENHSQPRSFSSHYLWSLP